jgi:hypothetical protein
MLYLDCSCHNLSLEIFLELLWFSEYFRAFKIVSRLSRIVSGIKNKFEKNLSYWIGSSPWPDPTRSAPAQPPIRARPVEAHLGPGEARSGSRSRDSLTPPPLVHDLGVRAWPRARAPIKGETASRARRALGRLRSAPPPCLAEARVLPPCGRPSRWARRPLPQFAD